MEEVESEGEREKEPVRLSRGVGVRGLGEAVDVVEGRRGEEVGVWEGEWDTVVVVDTVPIPTPPPTVTVRDTEEVGEEGLEGEERGEEEADDVPPATTPVGVERGVKEGEGVGVEAPI